MKLVSNKDEWRLIYASFCDNISTSCAVFEELSTLVNQTVIWYSTQLLVICATVYALSSESCISTQDSRIQTLVYQRKQCGEFT